MTNIAQGVSKVLAYKKQTGLGSAASGSGGQQLRRTTSTINLTKEAYQSAEIRPDQQVADYRHGPNQVTGSIAGEISPGTYADLMAAVLRQDFTAVSSMTSAAITLVASTGVITFQTGNPLTSNIKIGHVVRLSGGSLNASNSGKNLLVTAVTSTTLTVKVLNGSALANESTSVTGVTVAVPGKVSYVPSTAQTHDYFTIEHWFSDIEQSEVFSDVNVSNIQVAIPATGLATTTFPLVGLGLSTGTSQVLTSPTAISTSGAVAGANGLMMVNGAAVAVITSIDFDVNGNTAAADAVVGANSRPDVFQGTVAVTGNMTVYFTDATFRDYFINETEVSVNVTLTTSSDKAADFISFQMPRVKVGGADVTDGQNGLTRSFPFVAIKDVTGGANESTTIMVQDSAA
jgi:hypothetical protein